MLTPRHLKIMCEVSARAIKKRICLFLFALISNTLSAQIVTTEWDHVPVKYNKVLVPDQFKNSDAVIISDNIESDLTDHSTKMFQRTVVVKIQSEAGLEQFNSVSLPEVFDFAENKELWQQGRASKIKIPFLHTSHVLYFIARIIRPNGKIINLSPKDTYSKAKRISTSGEYFEDDVTTFSFKDLKVNDLLEYSYKIDYKPSYGNDVLYLASPFPKLYVKYQFKYFTFPKFRNSKYIFTENIPDSCMSVESEEMSDELAVVTQQIQMRNIPGINYFIHALSATQLPYALLNVNYTIRLIERKRYTVACSPDLGWREVNLDKEEMDWYTKVPLDIKKFISKMPVFENDTNNLRFVKALSDTLNSFKYLSSNYLFYNDPRLYSLYATDHLFKRRLVQRNMLTLYRELLNEKGMSYFIADVQDKRLGEHSPHIWKKMYENIIFMIPVKEKFYPLIPRYNGLSYFLNELPYYYEDAVAALFPVNYGKMKGDTVGQKIRFITTFSGNDAQNVRIEDAFVKVKTDSAKCDISVKESLSGQFSTILRHYYLHENIDSTIDPVYFKKCIDIPEAKNKKWILKARSEKYPFIHEFNCSATVSIKDLGVVDLHNWFSFKFDKQSISGIPTHDFYFDFVHSDFYNFKIEFDRLVNVTNANDFAVSLDNDFFEVSSSLDKKETSYFLSVAIKIKQKKLPKEEASKFLEFIQILDKINSFKIRFKNN
jgi:hypothetical protein